MVCRAISSEECVFYLFLQSKLIKKWFPPKRCRKMWMPVDAGHQPEQTRMRSARKRSYESLNWHPHARRGARQNMNATAARMRNWTCATPFQRERDCNNQHIFNYVSVDLSVFTYIGSLFEHPIMFFDGRFARGQRPASPEATPNAIATKNSVLAAKVFKNLKCALLQAPVH